MSRPTMYSPSNTVIVNDCFGGSDFETGIVSFEVCILCKESWRYIFGKYNGICQMYI